MSTEAQPDAASNEPRVTHASIYQEFLAEREEILRHKWFRSEDAGEDIGFDQALVDWVINHRPAWKKERIAARNAC